LQNSAEMVGLSNAGYVGLGEASFPTLDKFQKVQSYRLFS